jgi:hypothetical protein
MSNTEKPQFLFLFRNRQDEPDPSPQQMEQIFGKWMAWMKTMKAKGQYLGGDRLNDAGKVIRGSAVTDGPFAEAKETIGGYILIAADDLAQATEIARGCPGLEYGTLVEVRPVEQMPAI